MKIKKLKSRKITFRYLPDGNIYCMTTGKLPRAFVRTPHGNAVFVSSPDEKWLEIGLADALNTIYPWYSHDKRHWLIAKMSEASRVAA